MRSSCTAFICRFVMVLCGAIGLATLLAAMPAWAKPASAEQARQVVQGWLNLDQAPLGLNLRASGADAAVSGVTAYPGSTGETAYYVVALSGQGLVVVPADDEVEPILAFTTAAQYAATDDNPFFSLVTRDVSERIQAVRALAAGSGTAQASADSVAGAAAASRSATALAAAAKTAADKWTLLQDATANLGKQKIASVSDVCVAPLVQSTWNQDNFGGSPLYNLYTPNNYYSGCVATAMAQLMRFHVYPQTSVGTASFTTYVCGATSSQSLRGGNGAGGAYDWANTVLKPDSSITPTQRAAIGALLADAGATVNMNYCSNGSGANTYQVATALKTTYAYANAVKGYPTAGGQGGVGSSAMINSSVDAGYPVLLSISNGSSGHAVVCDGYGNNASTRYHHINMGWGGYNDAWYNLPTIDDGHYNFTSVNGCVYNVFPSSTGEIISGRLLDENGSPISGATITATRASGGTYTTTSNGRGVYALRNLPSASTYTLSATHPDYAFGTLQTTNATSSDYSTATGNVWGMNFTGVSGPRGSLCVTLTPASLANAGAQWRVDGGAWNACGATVSNVAARAHTISFKGVPGWMEPQAATVTVGANATSSLTASYRELGTRGGSLLAMGFPVAVSGPHGEYAYAFPTYTLSTDWLNTNNASLSWSADGGVETFYGKALARCFSLALTKAEYTNVDVTARLRLRENYANTNAAGIYVRGNPGTQNSLGVWDSGYYFCLLNNGQVLVRKFTAGSVVTELSSGWLQTTAYTPSDWNDVRVVADNSALSFYVNGVKVFSTTDTTLKSGKVGIEFYDGSPYSYSGWLDVDQVTLKNF